MKKEKKRNCVGLSQGQGDKRQTLTGEGSLVGLREGEGRGRVYKKKKRKKRKTKKKRKKKEK